MAKKTPNQLATVPLTTVATLNVDKNDLLAIAVSRAETHLQHGLSNAQKEMKTTEKQVNEITKEITILINKTGNDLVAKQIKTLKDTLTELGSKHEITTNITSNDDKLVVLINIKQDQYNGAHLATKHFPHTKEITNLNKKQQELTTKLTADRETVIEWRKKLASIPTLERQARARLAESALSRSEEGKALLENLSDVFETDLIALPAV